MTTAPVDPSPLLTLVIPVHNEAGNILPLVSEITRALQNCAPVAGAYEIIVVDDGSTDASVADIRQAQAQNHRVRLIRHAQCAGMSPAIRTGVRAARADWIMTCDGDRQNDPADMPRLIDLAWSAGRDRRVLVCGIRVNRQDTLGKKLASKLANGVRRALLNDGCPDTGCALKMFRRDGYLEMPFFHGLHRFMPALFQLYDHAVLNTPVHDRPRVQGVSKSDFIGRGVRGLFDLLGVAWLRVRTRLPKIQED